MERDGRRRLSQTVSGRSITPAEALTPEEALALYLADPADLSSQRNIAVGALADLVLFGRKWNEAGQRVTSQDVAATFISGALAYQSA